MTSADRRLEAQRKSERERTLELTPGPERRAPKGQERTTNAVSSDARRPPPRRVLERLEVIAGALSVGTLDRHIILCAEQSTPRCATYGDTSRVWKYLKRRLKELGLASAPPSWRGVDIDEPPPPTDRGAGCVLRTKADCLRVCESGPIAVVYPEGIWYHSVDTEAMERIITEHLIGGRVVEELMFAVDRLSPDTP